MDYILRSGPVKKDRHRIGFLDDNQNHDFHMQIMMGIIEAAREFDVDIIRFGYYSSHIAYKFTHQVAMVLDHIEQYELDGLLFLGWTKAGVMYNRTDFMSRLGKIPMLSIGTEYDDVPSVFFGGNTYIQDMTRHLIEQHHYKRIAFIDHARTDARKDAYRETMEHYGLYDPLYCVNDTELEGFDTETRTIRAVEILLDERKLDVEAIISLHVVESGFLLGELQRRGIKVPGDIAITSYEDGEAARYLSPGFTTVYFPWRELGYNSCKKMVQLLRNGKIPFSTAVNSRIIYRGSCGCLPLSIRNTEIQGLGHAAHGLTDMTDHEKASVISALDSLHGFSGLDSEKLVTAFLTSLTQRDMAIFLSELGLQLRMRKNDKNVDYLLPDLRKLLYPYILKDPGILQMAGDMFLQSQVLISESSANIHGLGMVESHKIDQLLQDLCNSLLVNFSFENIISSLENGLPKLGIPTCLIFVSDSIFNDMDMEENLFENSVLLFRYHNGKKENTTGLPGSVKKQLNEILDEQRINISFAYLLHVTDEVMGFALFEPGPLDETIYQLLSTNISTALRGHVTMDRLNSTYNSLVEHARREGMADIAANILHNIGNILNSINVSMHLIEEGAKSTVFDDVARAGRLLNDNMERLEEFICSDVKGKKLMQLYLKLGSAAGRLQDQLRFNAERLQTKIGAINETIAAQQSYAGIDMKFEELSVEPILEDAIKVNQATLEKHEIMLERDYSVGYKAYVNRAKMFYIIVNLISNAIDAMAETAGVQRKLTVSLYQDDDGKYLCLRDTGEGMSEECREKAFDYGFSTKNDRYGNGLYNSAIYMAEMGGSIRAESDGCGKGAAFIISFGSNLEN